MQPWMSFKEIRQIEAIILDMKKDHLEIVEWGCGGSTAHFSRFLEEQGIGYHWTSIEHNREWYEKIAEETRENQNIEVHCFPAEGDRYTLVDVPMEEYINFPATLNKKFDLILVDGRKRKSCVELAKTLLKPDGVVLLHDALRPRYHGAFKIFPNNRFLSLMLWRGSLEPVGGMTRLKNRINYHYYRYVVKKLYRSYRNWLERFNMQYDYQKSRW